MARVPVGWSALGHCEKSHPAEMAGWPLDKVSMPSGVLIGTVSAALILLGLVIPVIGGPVAVILCLPDQGTGNCTGGTANKCATTTVVAIDEGAESGPADTPSESPGSGVGFTGGEGEK